MNAVFNQFAAVGFYAFPFLCGLIHAHVRNGRITPAVFTNIRIDIVQFATGRKFYRQEAFAIKPVDTLGAGDTFLSTFTSLYFGGRKLLTNYENVTGWGDDNEHVQECEDKLIAHALSYAAMGGAYACMSEGCYGFSMPYDHSLISRSNIDIEKAIEYFDAL